MKKFSVSSGVGSLLNQSRINNKLLNAVYLKMVENQEFFDPSEYIKDWEGVEVVLKFNNVYFKKNQLGMLKKALAAHGVDMETKTMKAIIESKDNERWPELWACGVHILYMKKFFTYNYYVCCDGHFLMKNLSVMSYRYDTSSMSVTLDGEKDKLGRAYWVHELFIGPLKNEDDIFFKNGLYGDCSVRNIQQKDVI